MIYNQPPTREHTYDACVIGSGPVGMALALELESLGFDVVILESGGNSVDPSRTQDSRAIIVNSARHAPMEIAVCRALGGTSWAWGGRCVPFDPVDFEERAHIAHSGWPIEQSDIKPWYAKASEYLRCGDAGFYLQPPPGCDLGCDITVSALERWSSEPRLANVHREKIERSERITLFLNATALDLDLGDNGQVVEGVVIAGAEGRSRIKARNVILAAGGIETTRFLLAIQRRWENHFGGSGGPLGRYYMGHISGKIASIVFDNPRMIADFDFTLDATGTYVRRRFMLSKEAQLDRGLLNAAFWPDNPPFHDPRHHSCALSAVFLALAFPPTGRRILPEAIRLAHVGPKPHHVGAHIASVALGAPRGARDILQIVRDRFLAKPRKPGFLLRNPAGRYALHYHSEQEPNPASRVVLTDEVDKYGIPRVAIDLRFTDYDAQSVIDSHELLDSALRANSVGKLEYWSPKHDLPDRVLSQASDGFHQVGTTRMGVDPRDSVVDPNLKVHDVTNLYVASSSVFPTTGQANSTYLATALAVRLAHHLKMNPNCTQSETGRTHEYAQR